MLAGMTPPLANAAVPTPYVNTPQYKKVSLHSLTKLFWWWFGLSFSVIPFLLVTFFANSQNWITGLLCVIELPFITSEVLLFILVYKFWQVIQDGAAPTSPGKAVGFMFIPLFNIYWWFVAYWGLSKGQNSFIERHFGNTKVVSIRKAHPAIALSFFVFSFLYILLYLILMINSISLAIGSSVMPTQMTTMMWPYNLILSILSFIQMGFMFGMFFDFFLTSKSILKAEENSQ
ncbi:MAG: hypothetical protein C0410_04460 [Anaerolinea sp.]|nr:hypothetical protein [Anaerolinea sp.]